MQSYTDQVTCAANYYGALNYNCAVSGYTLLGIIGFSASQYQNHIGIAGCIVRTDSVSTIWRNYSSSALTDNVTIRCLYVKN